METVLVFGAGSHLYKIFDEIVKKYKITAIIDNDNTKCGKFLDIHGCIVPVISAREISFWMYDKIIILAVCEINLYCN